jgi:hypothetical protein
MATTMRDAKKDNVVAALILRHGRRHYFEYHQVYFKMVDSKQFQFSGSLCSD